MKSVLFYSKSKREYKATNVNLINWHIIRHAYNTSATLHHIPKGEAIHSGQASTVSLPHPYLLTNKKKTRLIRSTHTGAQYIVGSWQAWHVGRVDRPTLKP